MGWGPAGGDAHLSKHCVGEAWLCASWAWIAAFWRVNSAICSSTASWDSWFSSRAGRGRTLSGRLANEDGAQELSDSPGDPLPGVWEPSKWSEDRVRAVGRWINIHVLMDRLCLTIVMIYYLTANVNLSSYYKQQWWRKKKYVMKCHCRNFTVKADL